MPSIVLTDPTAHTLADAGLIGTNNANLRTLLNGGLDLANLKGTPALVDGDVPVWNGSTFVKPTGTPSATTFLRGDKSWATPSSIPSGVVTAFGGAAAPTGWSLCDGSSRLRTGADPGDGQDYTALFAAIGVVYGSVDGTHFTLPDLRGRAPVGKGTNATVNALANNEGVAEANRRGTKHQHTPHTHNVVSKTGAGGAVRILIDGTGDNTIVGGVVVGIDGGSGVATDPVDGGAYLVINHIIKL